MQFLPLRSPEAILENPNKEHKCTCNEACDAEVCYAATNFIVQLRETFLRWEPCVQV